MESHCDCIREISVIRVPLKISRRNFLWTTSILLPKANSHTIAKRRPHGQIAAREGELRFGLRSESWAYRLGFIRTDWSGWAGLRGAHTPPCGGWSEVRGDGQKNKKRPPEGDRLVLQSHVCKNLWFS